MLNDAASIPLFLVGAPRSGTTLVRSVLEQLPDVYLLPEEFQILVPFVRAIERGDAAVDVAELVSNSAFGTHEAARRVWPRHDDLVGALETQGDAAAAFQGLVLLFAAGAGRGDVRVWGDKTPNNIFALDLIRRLWPNAKVIVIQRDPRETVASMRNAWGKTVVRSAALWRDSVREGARLEGGDEDALFLSFESVVSDPASELERIASWLGLRSDTSALARVASGERWGRARDQRGVQLVEMRWPTALSRRQVKRIEEICFSEMMSLGYIPTIATRPRPPLWICVAGAQLLDAISVVRSYARERGWRTALAYKMRQWAHRVPKSRRGRAT